MVGLIDTMKIKSLFVSLILLLSISPMNYDSPTEIDLLTEKVTKKSISSNINQSTYYFEVSGFHSNGGVNSDQAYGKFKLGNSLQNSTVVISYKDTSSQPQSELYSIKSFNLASNQSIGQSNFTNILRWPQEHFDIYENGSIFLNTERSSGSSNSPSYTMQYRYRNLTQYDYFSTSQYFSQDGGIDNPIIIDNNTEVYVDRDSSGGVRIISENLYHGTGQCGSGHSFISKLVAHNSTSIFYQANSGCGNKIYRANPSSGTLTWTTAISSTQGLIGFDPSYGLIIYNSSGATNHHYVAYDENTGVQNNITFPNNLSQYISYPGNNDRTLDYVDSYGKWYYGNQIIDPMNGTSIQAPFNDRSNLGTIQASNGSILDVGPGMSYLVMYPNGTAALHIMDGDEDGYFTAPYDNPGDQCLSSPVIFNWTDLDEDGCEDVVEDNDDDNDGYNDSVDACTVMATGPDYDSDGCQDIIDVDDDNDGVNDSLDRCDVGVIGWDSNNSTLDYDNDGCHDSIEDNDDDNDWVNDSLDMCPLGAIGFSFSNWTDNDNDGCEDITEDLDDDNDGINDTQDLWPLDNQAYGNDTDGDNYPDIIHVSRLTIDRNSTFETEYFYPKIFDTYANINIENNGNWSSYSNSSYGNPIGVANHTSLTPLQNQSAMIISFTGSGEFSFDYSWLGPDCMFIAKLNDVSIPLQFGNNSYQASLVSGNHSLSLNYFENNSVGDCNYDNLQLFKFVLPGGSQTFRFGISEDFDDDNDGYSDVHEAMGPCMFFSDPLDNNSIPPDIDSDFICDALDEDIDGDGYGNLEDYFPLEPSQWNDTDGDGYGDNLTGTNPDLFPNDSSQWNDTDGDGFGDNYSGFAGDAFPNDANASKDTDGDGKPDQINGNSTTGLIEDMDDDNDGFNDSIDPWPLDNCVGEDHDGDGLADNVLMGCQTTVLEDGDDDGDTKLDQDDFCPVGEINWLSGAVTDHDADGCRDDGEDNDDDNDGLNDSVDLCPRGYVGWISNPSVDADNDGCHDSIEDNDDDNDGVSEPGDQCPNTPIGVTVDSQGCPIDSDSDGVADYLDNCSNTSIGVIVDANGCPVDSDGDGTPDYQDDFPNDANETMDSDGDGVGDNSDSFPNDANETADSDGDGVGDNSDSFPNDANETLDSDGDGVGDNSDSFPNDANETTDSDGDGVGDNSDSFPNDANETADSDGDGVGDNSDECQSSNPMDEVENDGCVLETSTSETSSLITPTIIGISTGVILLIIMGVVLIRRTGGSIEEERLLDQEPMPVNSPIEIDSATEIMSQDTNPPESEIGVLGDDGYYWLEWPTASGLWYYRAPSETIWSYFEK